MAKSRVLVAYKSADPMFFGDQIRVKSISAFLQKNHFQIIEALLPSISRWGLWRCIPSILPLRKGILPILSYKDFLIWLDLNVSMNSLKQIILKTHPNVVLAETSLVGWAATNVCKKLSIPCIVDCHGLAFAEAKGRGHHNWQRLKHLEKEAFTRCDYLLVVSKKMKEYIHHEFKTATNKIMIIPNGSQPQQCTAQYRLPINVIYAGVFAYWEKIYDFLEIAKQADNRKFKFYMAGAGPLKKQLIHKIKNEKIPVKYFGYIPRQKIFTIFSKMQIGIAPSTRDLARIVASPIKVFDYMSSGLPVIAPKIGDWGNILTQEDCGIALENDSVENYIEALNMLTQKNNWMTKSKNALKAIREKYNWNKILEPLVNLIATYAE